MNSNSKILTVSYGTFSCTLEGFDDSFGTMKAIAEYFRDLSSGDRYFGAEPPQPDAEMLSRIAEREISRRVEVREKEGRIVLSASDAQSAPAASPALAGAGAALAGTGALAAKTADDAPATDTVVAKETVQDTPQEDTSDTTTAVREDEVAPQEDEVAPQDDAAEVEAAAVAPLQLDAADAVDVQTPQPQADVTVDTDAVVAEQNPPVAVIEPRADMTEDTVAAFFADATVSDSAASEPPAAVAPGQRNHNGADSIAAKLKRIRAVVSQGQKEAEDDELFEDEHADISVKSDASVEKDSDWNPTEAATDAPDTDQPASADVIADAARDIEAAAEIDDEIAADDKDHDIDMVDADGDDISDVLARIESRDNEVFETDAPDAEKAQDENENAHLGRETPATLMAADDDKGDAEDAGDNIFDENDVAKEAEAPEIVEAAAAKTEAEAAPRRRARVVKVKRTVIDDALTNGQLEEVDAEASSLSEKDEAELMADLAEVEADLVEVEADLVEDKAKQPEDAEPAQEDAMTAPAAAEKTAEGAEVKDDDVSRLMAEADNQMDEPEGHGRRNAFAHLKAAVMAKKADAAIGDDSSKGEDAFRSDLASAVKPRRPEAGSERSERPEEPRPGPLKLVAEQRVDVEAAASGPVHPRRVAKAEDGDASANAQGSFAEYAVDQGAHDLSALLEAAASYLSFVEGRDQFSRPQLMNKVRQVEQDEFSREDGLRSFGQLLRAGKIEKTKGGRFAVTNDIGFRPDERAAG